MFFDTKKNDIALILDIGNGSVGGALAVITKERKPKVLFSHREIFSFDEKPTAEKLEIAVLKTLEQILSVVLPKGLSQPYFKKNSKKIDTILCVLSSPWFISQGKTVSVANNKQFVITERFLQDIISKELQSFEKIIAETSITQSLKVIEQKLLSTKINGYEIKNPIGQKTSNFETSLYISKADKNFIQKIAALVSKHTHKGENQIIFHSFPLIAHSTISEMFPGIYDYIHFDIAGEITDISLVRAGMIRKTASYPSGMNLLFRRIAKRLGVPIVVARSFYHLYMDKRADPDTTQEIEIALSESQNEWNVYINDALASLTERPPVSKPDPENNFVETSPGDLTLPEKIFITSYPRTFEIFKHFLATEVPDETLSWRKGLSVTYLGSELLSHFLTTNPAQQFDAFIALEAFYLSENI